MKITKALLEDIVNACDHAAECGDCKYVSPTNVYGEGVCSGIQRAMSKARHPLSSAVPQMWQKQDIQGIYEVLTEPLERAINAVKEAEDEDN